MAGVLDRPVQPLGLPDPDFRIVGAGLADSVDFGTGAVVFILLGVGLSDEPTFGSGSLALGTVDVVDDEVDTFAPTFGDGSINPGSVDLGGIGLQDLPSFGVGEATIGGISVLDDEDDVFAPVLGSGSIEATYEMLGSGLSVAPSFGAGTVSPGPVYLAGYGIPPEPRVGRGVVVPTYYYFVGPTLRYGHGRRNSPLWWVENAEGVTLLRESGVWREALCPTGDEIAAAERAYRGGYRTPLTGDQKNELVAAGYGAYIEED